jgi:hypothetical protein
LESKGDVIEFKQKDWQKMMAAKMLLLMMMTMMVAIGKRNDHNTT